MADLGTVTTAEPAVLAEGYLLEKQLRIAERRYAEARRDADQARDEWRALTISAATRPEQLQAARARFEAVAARCNRLRGIIDDLEDRIA